MVPIGIDCADQLRHGHVAVASDLLHALPELLLKGDACLVACNDNGTLENRRLHCFVAGSANSPTCVFCPPVSSRPACRPKPKSPLRGRCACTSSSTTD